MRYYYDCPLKAAYMAKNFDFIYHVGNNVYCDWDEMRWANWQKDTRDGSDQYYYLIWKCLDLLSPQLEDIIREEHGGVCTTNYAGVSIKPHFWKVNDEHDLFTLKLLNQECGIIKNIVERNNKHFLMPKVEL